jgi:hypothetical protein
MNPPPAVETPVPESEDTGIPGIRTWRGLYVFVFGSFVLWVVMLFALTMIFS